MCIIYPAKIIAMGAAFLSLLNSNLYPINSSSLQRSEIDSNSNYSITEIARVWYELIKDDITIDELMGNYSLYFFTIILFYFLIIFFLFFFF